MEALEGRVVLCFIPRDPSPLERDHEKQAPPARGAAGPQVQPWVQQGRGGQVDLAEVTAASVEAASRGRSCTQAAWVTPLDAT
ncbi:hypothetical protein J1605_010918 [Eschrichtius robustus]|uniref:Uncharacterized protein n=1 Tax=Eschrichtius robustus TaxID=9764 RepID=A0AB34GSS0_ESCRO|nr:hypothetical protein J1605_010918 [Eschrichtius robustus]